MTKKEGRSGWSPKRTSDKKNAPASVEPQRDEDIKQLSERGKVPPRVIVFRVSDEVPEGVPVGYLFKPDSTTFPIFNPTYPTLGDIWGVQDTWRFVAVDLNEDGTPQWPVTALQGEAEFQSHVDEGLAIVQRIREERKVDQADIDRLKAETRAILAQLDAV